MTAPPYGTNGVGVGDPAPDFNLPIYPGGEFNLESARGKTVVLYFFPKDDTPGCTKEACGFRDHSAEFAKYGALIYGVSKDTLKSHEHFITKYKLPFPLLSDTGGALRRRFGNPDGGAALINRITYIIDQQGVVRHIINGDGKASVPDHITQALEWAKKLASEKVKVSAG